jgi:nitrous oxide reductase
MNSKTIDLGIVLLTRNHAIFVILSIILVSTAVASSQMASAKNTEASTSPFTSTQRQVAASNTPNQTNASGLSSLSQSATTIRIFNIYTTHVTGFNEIKGVQKANLTDDQYSLQTLLVNQGDKIVVNLYNMEAPSGDRHSFTIDAPYNVNIDTAQGGNGTAAFVADHVGIFKFYCKYHIPSMVGELVILPSRM